MDSACKNCLKCNSNKIVKNGFQSGRTRFKCKECGKKFQSKKQLSRRKNSVITDLVSKKRYLDLNISPKTIECVNPIF